jgi:hypothetical protein
MRCKVFQNNIPSLISNTCKAELKKQMNNHLESCASCVLLMREVEITLETGTEDKIEVDPFFFVRLESRMFLNSKNPVRQFPDFRSVKTGLALAASVFLGIFLGTQMMKFNSSDTEALISTDPIVSELSLVDMNTSSAIYFELINDE